MIDCKISQVEQGGDEWLELRRGRITCSRLGDVMAKPTSQRYQNYQTQIAQELCGIEQEEQDAPWFAHGKALEPRALAAFEWKYKEHIGTEPLLHDVFLVHNEYDWLGCSPDGLYPDFSEGVEVKCRALYKNYRKEVARAEKFELINPLKCVSPEYRFQVQGGMWVTGLDRWKYVNYYEGPDLDGNPQRKLHVVDIPRDENLINQMELRALVFMRECYEIAGKEI